MQPRWPGEDRKPSSLTYPSVEGDGSLFASNGPLGIQLQDRRPQRAWITLTGNAAGTNRYAWSQLDDNDAPLFATTLGSPVGASGTTDTTGRCAYDLQGRGIGSTPWPVGTNVEATYVNDHLVFGEPTPPTPPTTWKSPVRVASTKASPNVSTDFANGQVVDGITLATDDRILIREPSTGVGGIYLVNATGAPTVAPDADNTVGLLKGAIVTVRQGNASAGTLWQCADDQQTWFQIGEDSFWKRPCQCVAVTNGTLSSAFAAGSVVDGVTLAAGRKILLVGQTTQADNGPYIVQPSGAPLRDPQSSTAAQRFGAVVAVTGGTVYADTLWLGNDLGSGFIRWTLIFSQKPAASATFVPPVNETLPVSDGPFLKSSSIIWHFDPSTGAGSTVSLYRSSAIAGTPCVVIATDGFGGGISVTTQALDASAALSPNGLTLSPDGVHTAFLQGYYTATDPLSGIAAIGFQIGSGGGNVLRVGTGFGGSGNFSHIDVDGAIGLTGALAPGAFATGGIISNLGAGSFVGTATANTFTAPQTFHPASAANVPVIAQGASGQTANLIQAKTNAGAVVFSVSPAGVVTAAGGFVGALTGNADTATQLATARNINGVAFDGTADIGVGFDGGTY